MGSIPIDCINAKQRHAAVAKKYLLAITLTVISWNMSYAQLKVGRLLCENKLNPFGVDTQEPEFSWILESGKRGVMQTAFELRVAETKEALVSTKNLSWSSGKTWSGQSVNVPYKGNSLQSVKKYYWQVRVWDNQGETSAWSTAAEWQMGLLSKTEWKAQWIEIGYPEDAVMRPSPMFRKEFAAGKQIKSATLLITSHGLYEASINGKRVGNAYFTPGWTSYKKRLQYQQYDVTSLLQQGDNAVGVTLGSGWYRGNIGGSDKNQFGDKLALLYQLHITYADGSKELVLSDDSWKSTTGAIRYADIYNGETFDARMYDKNWAEPKYNDSKWSGVKVASYGYDNLVTTQNELVTKHEIYKPVKFLTTPKGEKIVDFGQNLVGWPVIKVRGKSGDTIRISHAEVLDKTGNFYTENLRSAKATDNYILKGGGVETFEPHFTWHGFRYVRIEGYPGELKPEDITAVTLYSDMPETGQFTTSNPMVNQLQHNIVWGQKGNFLDVPTDCPQRDERLGWAGDAQVFSRTATFNMNVNNFFGKWMKDVAADQFPDGSVPSVIPFVMDGGAIGSAGWADVATIVPWDMYLAYGNKKILEQQYHSMKAWVDYMKNKSNNGLWDKGNHYGDWLFYRPFDDNDGRASVTNKYLIAQCFFAHSTQLLINTAKVLHKADDVIVYQELLKKVKTAFIREYTTASGNLVSGTQTAYVLALNFDMLPDSLQKPMAKRLANNIIDYGNHLTTGFLGTPYLCHVLSRFGYDELAYKLLLQDTFPSWLYPIKMGATTIWERWDGQRPDGTFQNSGMNSFNHYAYGAIGDWMYRTMAGLDTYADGPGYKHIKIQPHIGGGFTEVSASLQTYYGKLSNTWKIERGNLLMDVVIPANTTASVYIPATAAAQVKEGSKNISTSKGIEFKGMDGDYAVVELGSGTYHFETAAKEQWLKK